MATEEKVREFIAEIAGRQKNVTESEIKWVVDQLESLGREVWRVSNEHQVMYCVDGAQFGVCTHHKGGKQIKSCYVRRFLTAMSDIGLYEG